MHSLGYVRISDPEKQDPASQVKLMQDRGIAMEDIFIDMISGAVEPGKRVAYRKLKERIGGGDITELVVSEYSRIGRDTIESLIEVLGLLRAGVKIQSLSDREKMINQYPNVTMQLIAITLSLDSAQQERDHIRERTRWGLQRVREQGSKSGKKIGRPEVPIDFDEVTRFAQEKNLKVAQVLRVLGIKPRTFYARKKASAKTSAKKAEGEEK